MLYTNFPKTSLPSSGHKIILCFLLECLQFYLLHLCLWSSSDQFRSKENGIIFNADVQLFQPDLMKTQSFFSIELLQHIFKNNCSNFCESVLKDIL